MNGARIQVIHKFDQEAMTTALDFARTTCRHAERRVCALQESNQLQNPEIVVYLNRLSDTLWLLARWAEANGVTDDQNPMTKK